MIETEALKRKMKERDISVEAVSRVLEIDQSTFYRKLGRNDNSFTIEQAQKLTDLLGLSAKEACQIFFKIELA